MEQNHSLEISINVDNESNTKTVDTDKSVKDISTLLKFMFIKHDLTDGVLTIRKTITRDFLVKALDMANVQGLDADIPVWTGSKPAVVTVKQLA